MVGERRRVERRVDDGAEHESRREHRREPVERRNVKVLHLKKIEGQICDACRISATPVSAPKRLKVVVNTNIFFSIK